MLALPTGETFVLGRDRKEGVLAVEWWSAKGGASKIASLPGHIFWDRWDPSYGPKFGTLVADGPDSVYAIPLAPTESPDTAYLARFDGSAWHAVDVSVLGGPIALIAAGRGSVIVSAKGGLWQRTHRGDEWQPLRPPFEHEAEVGATVQGGRLVMHGSSVYFVSEALSQPAK